ncbi:MAG TPA: hypothetical protein VJJ76_02225 [archaeon]|nr:hypothetical protein [archaeon]
MKTKIKIISAITLIAFLLTSSSAFALGLTAGPVRIVVDVGASNSSRFGLLNNGNETITVAIRAEGDAAQFLTFPTSLELVPKKLTYVDVTATIPADYDGSLGGNITGFMYALQEGSPGQVQINVQARKVVQILVPQYGGKIPEKTTAQTSEAQEAGEVTGFAALLGENFILFAAIGAGVVIFIAFVIFSKFDISINPKRR